MSDEVCPVWMGYGLLLPVRRLFHKPERLFAAHVKPGMSVLDFGCAMGYFSLPLARLAGPQGNVLCVDLQQAMLDTLARRARRAGLSERMELHRCGERSLGLEGREDSVDFALSFAVLHEVPDPDRALRELFAVLRPGGRLVLAEPRGHVAFERFEGLQRLAREAGFRSLRPLQIPRSQARLWGKPG